MSSNSFGNIFRITTWGESHGKAIGVVIDGCPAGLALTEEDIQQALNLRSPGMNPYTSPRVETDKAEIYSGVFEGMTTGTPISIIIHNQDADSSKYEAMKNVLRPGHANFSYLEKYGVFDYRGGGRSSARETACRVAAGAIAKKLLATKGIQFITHLCAMGDVTAPAREDFKLIETNCRKSPLFVADPATETRMIAALESAKAKGDSLGGIVEFIVLGLPTGLGDPMYEKLEANLAKAMLSIHASKGFEIGLGFAAAGLLGSEHNDLFIREAARISTTTNHAGGTLGGISTGQALIGRVAFKPTSSIQKPQATVDIRGEATTFNLPQGSRHDPCVAIRAVPVVEAMCALVLIDAMLMARSSRWEWP